MRAQETLKFVCRWCAPHASLELSLWSCLHSHRYFIQCVWPYLCMPLKKEEALDKTQTSPICISLRRIPISKQSKNQVLWQEHASVKIWTGKSEHVIKLRVGMRRCAESHSETNYPHLELSPGRPAQPPCSILPLARSRSFVDTWK